MFNSLRSTWILSLLSIAWLSGCTKDTSVSQTAATPVAALDFQEAISFKPTFDGAAQAVIMQVNLKPGYHIYTTGETIGRPVRMELQTGGDWKPTGEIEYPTGSKKVTSLGTSVVVEHKAMTRMPVAPAVDEPGKLIGRFFYQVCTNEACDRPRSTDFELDPINEEP